MTARSWRRIVSAAACGCLVWTLTAPASTQDAGLRGFTNDEVAIQRQREQAFKAVPKADLLREYMKEMSAEPHHAGSPGSLRVASYAVQQFKSWGLDAWVEQHEALMPMPVERIVQLVGPEQYTAVLKEPPVPEDPDSSDAGQLPTFNAYSADGDVTAQVVYVNYGVPADYEELAKLGIDVAGKIVIARYGGSWRGIKPKVAAEHGAVGCLIYSDPKDDGFYQGDVYPKGAYRPEQGVQRGSVMDMPLHPGDPLTPGWGAEPGGRRLDRSEATTLVKIPVLPISWGDALPILRNLGGQVAPEAWRGALPITYHIGAGPATVRVKLSFDWQVRPLYNAVARIPGSQFPDQWIVHGNHHDAWVNGASDPTSGGVSLLETARGFSELLKQGWRPKRTIVLALWDGEEWGLLGSTEWAEKHAAELREKAVVYINTDSNGPGWIGAGGSHSLGALMNEVARDVNDPKTGSSVLDALQARNIERARTPEDKERAAKGNRLVLGPLGSGSDYTAFLDFLNVASLNLGFGGAGGGGVYHSIYDSFAWHARFGDTDFAYGVTLSQTVGSTILRLADAAVLPFQFTDYAATLSGYVDEVDAMRAALPGGASLDLTPIREAVSKLKTAADAYEQALLPLAGLRAAALADRSGDLAALNALLYTAERRLGYEQGLPRRNWFKHLIYAPGFYTGYGVKTLPAIREGIEEGSLNDARAYVPVVADAIAAMAGQVQQAAAALGAMTR